MTLPIWILCVVTGLVLLISPRARFLSAQLISAATLGAVTANVLAPAFLFGLVWLGVRGTDDSMRSLLTSSYFVGLVSGAVLGVVVGIHVARKLNRALSWEPPKDPKTL
jgi:Na+/proline symporter